MNVVSDAELARFEERELIRLTLEKLKGADLPTTLMGGR